MSELQGIEPGTELEPTEEVRESGIEYVSKSRIKTLLQCPRKFFYKYCCGVRPPGTYYTERGTEVHETFEEFHGALSEFISENGTRPGRLEPLLPDDTDLWAQWIEMVGHFFAFEERRWKAAAESYVGEIYAGGLNEAVLERWNPVEIEAEAWLGEPPQSWINSERGGEPDYVSGEPPVGDAPWMGRADVIVDTRSVPNVDGNGVTIIDYKTGSVPDEQYRDEGVLLEGEYYGRLFENFYEIDAVAGYYPSADELIVAEYPNTERWRKIKMAAMSMQQQPDIDNFDIEEQPLCHYDHGACYFYDECPSTWGQPQGPGPDHVEVNQNNSPRYNVSSE